MTTGDPIVARVAMKPLPTLTKPLRSVDIEHQGAGPGAPRAHRLLHGARGRCGGRGDARTGARRGLPGEVRRRRHAGRAGGRRALQVTHRMAATVEAGSRSAAQTDPGGERRPERLPEARIRGFHVRRQVAGHAQAGAPGRREALDADALLEERLGEPIASFFAREGEVAFRERERELVLELLARPGPAFVRARGRGDRLRGGAERARATTVVYVEVEPETAWERASGTDRPLARDRERFFDLYARRVPRVVRGGGRGRSALALRPTPATGICGPFVGHPVRRRWSLGGRRAVAPRRGARVRGRRRARRGAARRQPAARLSERVEIARLGRDPAGGAQQDARRGRAGAARARAPRACSARTRSSRSVAGWWATSPGSAPPRISVAWRWCMCPTTVVAQVDSAYGGKTGVDLPEAQELRRRVPPAGRRDRRPATAARRFRTRSCVPASRRS